MVCPITQGDHKKKDRNHRMKIYMVSLLHRATINKPQGKNIMSAAAAQVGHNYGRPMEEGSQAIIFLSCGFFLPSFLLSFFSPNLSRRRLDVYHTSTQWCGLSANLERRSETCCTRLAAGNTKRKKSPSRNTSHNFLATKAHIDNRKNLVKQQCLPHTSSQYGELRPTSG